MNQAIAEATPVSRLNNTKANLVLFLQRFVIPVSMQTAYIRNIKSIRCSTPRFRVQMCRHDVSVEADLRPVFQTALCPEPSVGHGQPANSLLFNYTKLCLSNLITQVAFG